METNTAARAGLFGGAVAAIVASVCCLGPLALVTVGLGGAWLSNLTALEAYRPVFIVLALGFMGLAYRHIFMAPAAQQACEPGTPCAAPATNRRYKGLFWVVSAMVLVALTFPYFLPLFY
jgi:mercuric ion transport protein